MLNSERMPWDRVVREGYPFEDMEKLNLPLQTLDRRLPQCLLYGQWNKAAQIA
jgi:hypothetical protein